MGLCYTGDTVRTMLTFRRQISHIGLIIGMLLAVSLFFVSVVFAQTAQPSGGNKDEIAELQERKKAIDDKRKEIEKSIEAYNEKIDAVRLEGVSLANQMAILDNQLTQLELDIQATEARLDSLGFELEALNLSIEDTQTSIDKQQIMLAELIRTIHYNDNKKTIEVLAAYGSFSEFYDQTQYIRTVERDLGGSAKALRLAKEDLEEKQTQVTERKLAYENVKLELDEKRQSVEEQAQYKETLLAQTKASELTFKTLVASLKSQHQQIQNDIDSIERQVRQKLAAQDKIQALDDNNGPLVLSWPTQSRYVTAYFNDTSYPYRHVFEHNAIDIRAAHGTPLKAAASGYVARARRCTTASCYAYVMIVHADGISTVYGHMSQILVTEDQYVSRGDVIGYSGATPGTVGAGPFTTGPHLHFEVRVNGIPRNPLEYLVKDY